MTGPELYAIRKELGLTALQLGRAFGYEGSDNTVKVTMHRYEAPNGRRIPPWIARLAQMYGKHGVPKEFL